MDFGQLELKMPSLAPKSCRKKPLLSFVLRTF